MRLIVFAFILNTIGLTYAQTYTGQFYSPMGTGLHTDPNFNLVPNGGATAGNSWNVFHQDGNPIFTAYFADAQPRIHVGQFKTTHFLVNGKLGVGTINPRGVFDVSGEGDIFLTANTNAGTAQSAYLPGHIFISPYSGSDVSYIQARRQDNSGTTSLRFRTYNGGNLTEALHIGGDGNVGVGTSLPQAKLDLYAPATESGIRSSATLGGTSTFTLIAYTGGYETVPAYANKTVLQTFDNSIALAAYGSGSSNQIQFYTGGRTDAFKRMVIDQYGNVGIGTSSPNQKLTVNGTIYGKEVKVDLAVPGPDYVFEKEYALLPLESIQAYVNQHKHLPEVPSARDMETNGINLSEMNMLLLKKIEELTLHAIKQNEALQKFQLSEAQLMERLDKLEREVRH